MKIPCRLQNKPGGGCGCLSGVGRQIYGSLSIALQLVNFHLAAQVSMCVKSKPKWFSPFSPREDDSVRNSKVAAPAPPPVSRLPRRTLRNIF